MTRVYRTLVTAILLLAPALVLSAAAPARASGLRWVETLFDTQPGIDGLNGAAEVAISPDGRHVYVAGKNDSMVALFDRDSAGALTFVEVYSNSTIGVAGLDGARAVLVSGDGAFVYVASSNDDAVVVFSRDALTGRLAFLELHVDGRHGVNGLEGAAALALSPDGQYLYVVGLQDNALTVFARDPATGLLTFRQMRRHGEGVQGLVEPRSVTVSPDGAYVYAAGSVSNTVAVFGRSPSGALVFVEAKEDGVGADGILYTNDVLVSPDGAHLYATGGEDDALALFRRDPVSGTLSFVEAYFDGEGNVDGINGAEQIAISPDGLYVYVTGDVDDAVAVFSRDAATGALTFIERIRDDRPPVDGLDNALGVAVSPDHTSVYVAGSKDDALVRFAVRRCGDQVTDPGEECDAGSLGSTCCTPSCTAEAAGTTCDDGAFCTVNDACAAGLCQGAAMDCSGLSDACTDGACDEGMDACVAVPKTDGTSCDDGDACTIGDTCQVGSCTAGAPMVCTAQDQCHDAGVCNPATGVCSNPAKANGASCNDGNACTTADTCQAGSCAGGAAVVCPAPDQCHVGICDPSSGVCSVSPKADGATCNDGNACTRTDSCSTGACVGANAVVCTATDECHEAGTCDPATGTCSNPAKADGAPCDDGDVCTLEDSCVAGTCEGSGVLDGDADGVCDATDMCPAVFDPAQADDDRNGVGDACECSTPAPGRCLPGGGSSRSDCLLEFNPSGPVTLSGARLSSVLRCADGDPACDRDGRVDGKCTFGLSACLGNNDPRLSRCQPADVLTFEIMSPHAQRSRSPLDQANALAFEEMLASLGLEVRRGKTVIAAATGSGVQNVCSPLIELSMPAPAAEGRKPIRRKFRMRTQAGDGRRDADRLVLECGR